jgi:2',3'-cyclic-nucleotide 2'-phosphodiesterase
MRILFLGDICGRAGREKVVAEVALLRQVHKLDVIIANGENAAHGYGITEKIYNELMDAGVDCITLGNHAFDQREALTFINRVDRLVRPVNFPEGTPGKGAVMFEINGFNILVINAMGRVYMDAMDDPFRAIDKQLEACPLGLAADAIIVDFHAEATSEKQIMGHYLDGRVSLVVGTHTHVPTSDVRILAQGTGYMTDAGMCGDYNGVIGMEKEEPMRRMLYKTPGSKFEVANGPARLSGVIVETNAKGLAVSITPLSPF